MPVLVPIGLVTSVVVCLVGAVLSATLGRSVALRTGPGAAPVVPVPAGAEQEAAQVLFE